MDQNEVFDVFTLCMCVSVCLSVCLFFGWDGVGCTIMMCWMFSV